MIHRLNAALIGFGKSGRFYHAPILTSVGQLNLYKIFTRNKDSIKIAEKLYPEAEVVKDLDVIFNDNNVDLVVIATPNTSHFELAKEALLNNKHVVVDKPFTITWQEAGELSVLAQRVGLILTVYHNRRWDSDFKTVQKVLESDVLGELAEYEAHFDNFRNYIKHDEWKEKNLPGSGRLYDLGPHLIDQALCLFGDPLEIFADLRIQRSGGTNIDNFEVRLNYGNLKVTLKSGALVKEPLPHFILLGDRGSFVKYGQDVQEKALRAGIKPTDISDWGKEPEETWGTINFECNEINIRSKVESEVGDYREFYRNVYQAIVNKAAVQVTAEQAQKTIKLIELAYQSNKEKTALKIN